MRRLAPAPGDRPIEVDSFVEGRRWGEDREEPVRRPDGRIGRQDVPTDGRGAVEIGEVQRDPSTAKDRVDRTAVDLDLPCPARAVTRFEPKPDAALQPAATERTRHDGPPALDREDAVERQPDAGPGRPTVRPGPRRAPG